MFSEGIYLEKEDILIHLITISNALQYAYDNGFYHGNLSMSMLFLDYGNNLKVGGFNTPLNIYQTLCPLPDVEEEYIMADMKAFGQIWMTLVLHEKIELNDDYDMIDKIITQMPKNYQNLLSEILIGCAEDEGIGDPISDIIQLRSISYLYIYKYTLYRIITPNNDC